MRLSSMLCWTADEMRSRRSGERPTASGFADGNSWAQAEAAKAKAVNREVAAMLERNAARRKRSSSKIGASLQSGGLRSHEKKRWGAGGGIGTHHWWFYGDFVRVRCDCESNLG